MRIQPMRKYVEKFSQIKGRFERGGLAGAAKWPRGPGSPVGVGVCARPATRSPCQIEGGLCSAHAPPGATAAAFYGPHVTPNAPPIDIALGTGRNSVAVPMC
ncbi:unnamed protein product, partial [Iphiclides podalirius]